MSSNDRGVHYPLPVGRDYIPDGHAPDGQVTFYGQHTPWCSEDSHDEPGVTVEDHGPVCTCAVGPLIDAPSLDDWGWLVVDLVSLYRHGVYDRDDVVAMSEFDRPVRLGWHRGDDGVSEMMHLRSGDARTLAAALIRAADRIERLV